MATVRLNSGLSISMESAIAAAKTITVATNADPGVFTSTAHGYSNGDIVLLEVEGMLEVNGRLYVVYGSDANTFQLEDVDGVSGVDTTNYGTFTSGTAKKVTLGTSVTGVQDFSPSGGDPTFVDTTTVHDKVRKQSVVGSNPITYNLTFQWDPEDAGQIALRNAFETSSSKGIKIAWPDGMYMLFYGSVGFSGIPGGTSQGVVTTAAAITATGNATFGQ